MIARTNEEIQLELSCNKCTTSRSGLSNLFTRQNKETKHDPDTGRPHHSSLSLCGVPNFGPLEIKLFKCTHESLQRVSERRAYHNKLEKHGMH